MKAEDVLREHGFALEVIPPPRGLGAGCGLALRLSSADVPAAIAALFSKHAGWAAVHRLDSNGKAQETIG
jgi:hypothetical protein